MSNGYTPPDKLEYELNVAPIRRLSRRNGRAMRKSAPQIQARRRICPHITKAGLLSDGMNLNQELVKKGWCWWYRKYAPGNTELERLEREAREGKKGLWVDPAPNPPAVGLAKTVGPNPFSASMHSLSEK